MNMLTTITPRSDQMNSDDLIGQDRTITVTRVTLDTKAEQPVSLFFEGDSGKPYKPGKSMRRVLVQAWGADASAYTGRSLTLYRDPDVKFGGLDVGGIRISHMSHIDRRMTMALTVTRGSKKPFTVDPLVLDAPAKAASDPAKPPADAVKWVGAFVAGCAGVQDVGAFDEFLAAGKNTASRDSVRRWPELSAQVEAAVAATKARLAEVLATDDVFPGDLP